MSDTAKSVGSSLPPQTYNMRKRAVLAIISVVGRISLLTEWFIQVSIGWEGNQRLPIWGMQLLALPTSSLTQTVE